MDLILSVSSLLGDMMQNREKNEKRRSYPERARSDWDFSYVLQFYCQHFTRVCGDGLVAGRPVVLSIKKHLRGENVTSVQWFLFYFEDAVETRPKGIATDARYSIIIAARQIFQPWKIILDAWHLYRTKTGISPNTKGLRDVPLCWRTFGLTCTGCATARFCHHLHKA